ncbi:MAG TPA: nitroreductase family deazaflavin-dependent oxidoreductase [Gaiellaceae bacterium]|jgi:deazaflavin-dependent oxidoreductase (nitroreductase family)|nr:nitroreductase family deazaflavin-dependent oxidoreductase [Gaiellaceae bacterium]
MPKCVRRLLAAPVVLYRLRLGFLLGRRFLLLVHRGRRSGRLYQTVVEVVRWDAERGEAIVMSGWGRRSNWFRNVEAAGAFEVRLARERFRPDVRVLEREEAAAIFADYERRNRFAAPVVRAVLSRLAGFPYDGSPEARRRVVERLPLVGFRRPSI